MPVFNGASHLAEAVESVLAQTLAQLELVIVDDGSDDGSAAIIERFARADARVRALTLETNLGISAALNHGWRLARSPYLARLDADDVALPDRLARQLEFLDAHPSVACVGGAAIVIDDAGRPLSITRFPTANRAIQAQLLKRNCFAHPSVTLRRSALEQVGGYRFDQIEDYDLWLRLSERFELANQHEPAILYRLQSRPLSLDALEQGIRRGLAVRDAAIARRAGGTDPLAGLGELSPATLERLELDHDEVARALERRSLLWATVLDTLGRPGEADVLVEQAARRLGPRIERSFAAARELREAGRLVGARRPAAGAARLLLAFRREPRYALARLGSWLLRRAHGRDLSRSS